LLDRVQCHLCGEWFKALAPGHLRRAHDTDHLEYKAAFGLSRGRALMTSRLSRQRRRVMLRLLRTEPSVQGALILAQERKRAGDVRVGVPPGPRGAQTLEHRRHSARSAASASYSWQRKADQRRLELIRTLGFNSTSSYLDARYKAGRASLEDIKREIRTGQATLRRLMMEAGIPVRRRGMAAAGTKRAKLHRETF
jgi:hypothetical protein